MIAVLREVKYLENAQNETLESIPESATNIYSRNETFHKFLSNLDLIVAWYNKVRETLLDVEFPLVEGQLQEIDNQLQQAETNLNWNSEGLFDHWFISLTPRVVNVVNVNVRVSVYEHLSLMILPLESRNEILQCDHSNKSYGAVLLHGTVCLAVFYKLKF